MISAKKNLRILIYLSLVFPYIGIFGVGTQPLFLFFIFLYAVLNNKKLIADSLVIFISLSLFELIFSFISRYSLDLIRFDLILVCSVYSRFAIDTQDSIKGFLNKIEIDFSVKIAFVMLSLMLIVQIISPELVFKLNFLTTGYDSSEGGRGISYYAPEPGLGAFGLFSIMVIRYFNIRKEQNNLIIRDLLLIAGFLVMSSVLTSFVLIFFLLLYYYGRIFTSTKSRIFAGGLLFGILAFIYVVFYEEISILIDFPFQRLMELIEYSNNPDGSPALRITQMLDFFSNVTAHLGMYNVSGSYSVGFVSYITQIPVTTLFLIILLFCKVRFNLYPLLIFSLIMLPLGSPFFISLLVLNHSLVTGGNKADNKFKLMD